MADADECVALFSELGLSDLEAQVYVFLVQHSPATGYRIAKDIGRSFPSTYKALSSLRAKGAILVDDGAGQLSRAVPPGEFLDLLENRFRQTRRRATAAAEQLPEACCDTRIYQLAAIEQIYERSRKMLAECEERALIELFPEPLATLRGEIESAAARGRDITVRLYQPEAVRGVRIVQSPYGAENLRVFKSDWLALLIDGRQFLLANLLKAGKGVFNAIWSANPMVSRAIYDYANSDFHHYAFRPFLGAATSVEEVRAEYDRLRESFPPGGDLGFRDLLTRFAADWPSDKERVGDGAGHE